PCGDRTQPHATRRADQESEDRKLTAVQVHWRERLLDQRADPGSEMTEGARGGLARGWRTRKEAGLERPLRLGCATAAAVRVSSTALDRTMTGGYDKQNRRPAAYQVSGDM